MVVISSGRRSTRASGKRVVGDISTSSTACGSAKKLTGSEQMYHQQGRLEMEEG